MKTLQIGLVTIFSLLFGGQILLGQGQWVVLTKSYPAPFKQKIDNKHQGGGFEVLTAYVDANNAISSGDVFDSGNWGSGGHLSSSAGRYGFTTWIFIPVVETVEEGGRVGGGLAKFGGGSISQHGYAKVPDGPGMAKFAIIQKSRWIIGDKEGEVSGTAGAAYATNKNLIGRLGFSYKSITAMINVVSYTGGKATDTQEYRFAPRGSWIKSNMATLESGSFQAVEVFADDTVWTASASEVGVGNMQTRLAFDSEWLEWE